MKIRCIVALLLAIIVAPTHAAPSASPQSAPARFTPAACPMRVPADVHVDCGYLSVPEDRRRADSPLIALAVAVARAPGAVHAPDPVVYLSGGPGSAALPSTVTFARAWRTFLGNRDLIMLDQRGTGFSRPLLTCPEDDPATVEAPSVPAEISTLLRCRDRLTAAGVHLDAYSSAASAADLEDLRLALGYRQWNLFGISYGTRLALTAMRDYPDGIRSVVLDSVYPPQANLHTEMPANIARSFGVLFAACARAAACAARYPDLEATFYATVARLEASPITLTVRNPATGAPIQRTLDGGKFIKVLFRMLYTTSILAQLPKMISETAAGNYALLAQMQSQMLARGLGVSTAMYFAVQCNEEIPFATPAETVAATDAYPRLAPFFDGMIEASPEVFSFCKQWSNVTPAPVENEPVVSAIPTLLLSGEYDPITPPAWGQSTARALSHGYAYVFPGRGHAEIGTGACPVGMVRAFLRAPGSAPDAACIAGLDAPRFQ